MRHSRKLSYLTVRSSIHPVGVNFNIEEYINNTNGELKTYTQSINSQTMSGTAIVELVS